MFLKNSYVVTSTPTATFGSTRASEKSEQNETITSLRCRLGTSSLIWISRNLACLSGCDCCLGNLQRNAHRQWIIASTQSRA
jgi:hypothetical protein